ncbi:MAG: ATP-dependent acyl-CoA ligase [Pseudomonas sp.]|uniref:ATP-dependent acyl-CoA ligase n=1 Tax=Pseudomonas sp. TaxID=306 RepID=UPI00398241F9
MSNPMSKSPTWHLGEQDTVTAAITRATAEFADRVFLDFSGDTYTYAEIDRESTRLAHGLAALGVTKGDRVGTVLDNNVEAILSWFAINKLGAISVPVNTAYKGEFLRHQLDDCSAKVLIAEADYAQRIADVEDGLPHAQHLLQRGGSPVAAKRLKVVALGEVFGSADPLPDINNPEDLAMFIYTAGTTGPSKGCMISHNYVCNLARQVVINENRQMEDCNWTALPLFHMNAAGGSVLACLLVGARAAIYPRFSVSRFWPEIERSGATVVNLLGSMITFLAEAEDNEYSKRCFGQVQIVRGSPFPASLQEKWINRFGVKSAGSNAYGLTEAARVTTLEVGNVAPPGSSGRRNGDFDVRIVDDNENELPAGTPGEIIVRPRRPHVMFEGYWNRPEDTLRVMRNMWFHTGDIGKFDEDGFFYFVDRKKDYLRRRGENISSYEVETGLRMHPAIADVAVHAVFSDSGEDDVKATVVLKEGYALTEEELCRWAAERLPYFTVPRYFELRSDLPRNPVGRVLKYQLREEGCTPTTWDRETAGITLTKR